MKSPKNVLWMFLIVIGIVFALFAPTLAQDDVALTIYVDKDSLTVYVPGNQLVSLQDLSFEVVIDGQRQDFPLEDNPAFSALRFDTIPAPLCLRLQRSDTNTTVPRNCQKIPTPVQQLAASDIFWYDAALGGTSSFLIVRGVEPVAICPAGQSTCNLTFIPPTFTPTPNTPTPDATQMAVAQATQDAVAIAVSNTDTSAVGCTYTFGSGDNFVRIALLHNITPDQLRAANPNLVGEPPDLQPGDLLNLPPEACPTPSLSATPAIGGQFDIVVLNAGNLSNEEMEIRNNGASVNLYNWKIVSSTYEVYTFSQQNFPTSNIITLRTGFGTDTESTKFWQRSTPVWASGKTLMLVDNNGHMQATYMVP